MGDENIDNNQNDNQQPWLLCDALAIPGRKNCLPNQLEKLLPIFNLDVKESTKDHIKKIMLMNRLMSVQEKYVVCILFMYTIKWKASTWYFSLIESSITSWNQFQTSFLDKFGEDETPIVLVLELSHIRMDRKEKVKDFNQHFLSWRNRIPAESRPSEGVVTEFYTSSLPQTMAMFVKHA